MDNIPEVGQEKNAENTPPKPPGAKRGARRKAREAALQALFFMEMNPAEPLDEGLCLFQENFPVKKGSLAYFLHLVRGVRERQKAIDRLIRLSAEHWRLERMSAVDRNILRVAVFELMYCPDIPPRVAINEAIDLGKLFGSEDSGAFINGILDRIFLEHSGRTDNQEKQERAQGETVVSPHAITNQDTIRS